MSTASLPPTMVGVVPIGQLRPSPTNPRKVFRGLEALAESIRLHGIIHDILVRPIPVQGKAMRWDGKRWINVSHFEIIAGERRYRAAMLAGFREVQVKVMPMDDEQVREVQSIENSQRESLPAAKRQRKAAAH